MADMIFPEGIRIFGRKERQPDYILAELKIEPVKLIEWMKEHSPDAADIRLQIRESKASKLYICVDTWKPGQERKEPSQPPPFVPPPRPPAPPAQQQRPTQPRPAPEEESIDDIPF
jgi:hypothetical protein